jgi:membrane associated rhomboid family serine protease
LFPIRDLNPTRITPVVTILIIALSAYVYFFIQPEQGTSEEIRFLYERAAVSCEITTGQPLSVTEINQEQCLDQPSGQEPFPTKNVWVAVVVSIFLHGSVLHILGNMWFLWVFGNNIEEAYGTMGYLVLYLLSGLAATAGFVLLNPDSTQPLIGASGAIAGILGAYLVLFPTHYVLSLVFLFFVPVPAIVFLGLWVLGQFGIQEAGIAWEAHVAGFVFGVLVTLVLRRVLLARVDRLHRPSVSFPG